MYDVTLLCPADKYYMSMYIMLTISVVVNVLVTNLTKQCCPAKHPRELVQKVIGCILPLYDIIILP